MRGGRTPHGNSAKQLPPSHNTLKPWGTSNGNLTRCHLTQLQTQTQG